MTISFFSNFMNIHQLPFCEELMKHIGADDFKFVATRQMGPDRVQMGFEDMNVTKPFVVREYEDEEGKKEALRLAVESDVVIFGSAPYFYLAERMKHNKLTFKYNERILKRGDWMLFHPVLYKSISRTFTQHKNKNLYVLCASAYTQRDLSLYGFPKEKCFKWGYFPEVKKYPSYEYLREKKIGLKHPEVAISVAKHLKKKGSLFVLNIIGDGPMRNKLEEEIISLGLTENVHLLGAQSHDVVLEEMENADIFLFTSDRNEGWGAVLNEAMNAGCAVVADRHIGSVPFLLNDRSSGLVYHSHNSRQIYKVVDELISDEVFRKSLGLAAWKSINREWTTQNAVDNLFLLINSLMTGCSFAPTTGPCSYA